MPKKKCLWTKDCPNTPGTKWSPYFCPEHEKERQEKITKQLDALIK